MQPADCALQMLDRDEGRIGYEVAGEGPLVVCLPGMGELRGSYRYTEPALAGAGFRVATMDLRGHGDSDATFSRYDDVAAGQDALALVAYLNGPAVRVGNSMGAGAAVWTAAEQPGAIRGLALIAIRAQHAHEPADGAAVQGGDDRALGGADVDRLPAQAVPGPAS